MVENTGNFRALKLGKGRGKQPGSSYGAGNSKFSKFKKTHNGYKFDSPFLSSNIFLGVNFSPTAESKRNSKNHRTINNRISISQN